MTDRETLAGCLLITGTPGAGKTTVSRLVAERLPRAAQVDGDVFGIMLVSGRANMLDDDGRWAPGPEGQRQLRLRMVNLCSVADNFAEAGFTPVADSVVETRAELSFIARRLRARPLMLVVLCPPPDVARHRNATRAVETRVDYDFAPLARNQRRELGDLGWWLDSGEQTPEETAEAIVAEAARRAVVPEATLRAQGWAGRLT
ncbi:Chloramphenicol 3-O-phosphotransferase [Promicromonospora umidemergens]|uniref:Adenylylsulfate kinase-like enzyme n=1 Tax=Promicromonospora umidemergens TaxID=629679 RepID=A0ABP8X769_9MICO|nr:AAA family ATPase [Promicromonospora umidemergens]MCP2281419.1 Chloramphenicol 3-O-phosphotransferase [Promicromonospora umidemergens]